MPRPTCSGSGNILYVSPDAMYVSYQRYHPVIYPVKGGREIMPAQPCPAARPGVWVNRRIRRRSSHRGKNRVPPADPCRLQHPDRSPAAGDPRWSPDCRTGRDPAAGSRPDQLPLSTRSAIKDGKITYIGKGEVPGTLDNQFSMDEYNNNLRRRDNVQCLHQLRSVYLQQCLRPGREDGHDRFPDPYRRTGNDLLDTVHRRPALHGDLQADRPLLRDRPLDPAKPRRSSVN